MKEYVCSQQNLDHLHNHNKFAMQVASDISLIAELLLEECTSISDKVIANLIMRKANTIITTLGSNNYEFNKAKGE